MLTEGDFMRRCLKRASEFGARLFRQNVGIAWTGKVEKITRSGNRYVQSGSLIIRDPRPFRSGEAGMSDLIGWTPVEITEEHLGKTLAVYTAVETKKTNGRATTQQKQFITVVCNAGGKAGIARTDDDLDTILRG